MKASTGGDRSPSSSSGSSTDNGIEGPAHENNGKMM